MRDYLAWGFAVRNQSGVLILNRRSNIRCIKYVLIACVVDRTVVTMCSIMMRIEVDGSV
ncbi:hypothetical protein LguiB_033752 [Lonicera macranthoides]